MYCPQCFNAGGKQLHPSATHGTNPERYDIDSHCGRCVCCKVTGLNWSFIIALLVGASVWALGIFLVWRYCH